MSHQTWHSHFSMRRQYSPSLAWCVCSLLLQPWWAAFGFPGFSLFQLFLLPKKHLIWPLSEWLMSAHSLGYGLALSSPRNVFHVPSPWMKDLPKESLHGYPSLPSLHSSPRIKQNQFLFNRENPLRFPVSLGLTTSLFPQDSQLNHWKTTLAQGTCTASFWDAYGSSFGL